MQCFKFLFNLFNLFLLSFLTITYWIRVTYFYCYIHYGLSLTIRPNVSKKKKNHYLLKIDQIYERLKPKPYDLGLNSPPMCRSKAKGFDPPHTRVYQSLKCVNQNLKVWPSPPRMDQRLKGIKAESSCESVWALAMWRSKLPFSLLNLFSLSFLTIVVGHLCC